MNTQATLPNVETTLIAQPIGNVLGRNIWELRRANDTPRATNYVWLWVYSEQVDGSKPFYGVRRWSQRLNAGAGAWSLHELGTNATNLRRDIDAAIAALKGAR